MDIIGGKVHVNHFWELNIAVCFRITFHLS